MPKILNKGFSALRESQVYHLRRGSSEPSLHRKSNGYVNMLNDYTNLQRDYEIQGIEKRKIAHQLDILKNEFITLREELKKMQNLCCQICFSDVHNHDAIQMGDCGHAACKPCFVQSVVHSAIHLRQHNEVNTIHECWRCFTCRRFNYSFLQYQRGVLIVKYVGWRSELGDAILNEYRKLKQSLQLPSLRDDLEENELWQEMHEVNTTSMEQPVMSNDIQPYEETQQPISI